MHAGVPKQQLATNNIRRHNKNKCLRRAMPCVVTAQSLFLSSQPTDRKMAARQCPHAYSREGSNSFAGALLHTHIHQAQQACAVFTCNTLRGPFQVRATARTTTQTCIPNHCPQHSRTSCPVGISKQQRRQSPVMHLQYAQAHTCVLTLVSSPQLACKSKLCRPATVLMHAFVRHAHYCYFYYKCGLGQVLGAPQQIGQPHTTPEPCRHTKAEGSHPDAHTNNPSRESCHSLVVSCWDVAAGSQGVKWWTSLPHQGGATTCWCRLCGLCFWPTACIWQRTLASSASSLRS